MLVLVFAILVLVSIGVDASIGVRVCFGIGYYGAGIQKCWY